MPIFEGYCGTDGCERKGRTVEFLLRNHSLPSKPCPACGIPVRRLVGRPNVIWAKPLGWYNGETDNGQQGDGHWVYGEREDGTKYKEYITTRQQQLDYCRANGVIDPLDNDRKRGLDEKGLDEAGKQHTWDTTPATMVAKATKDDNWI